MEQIKFKCPKCQGPEYARLRAVVNGRFEPGPNVMCCWCKQHWPDQMFLTEQETQDFPIGFKCLDMALARGDGGWQTEGWVFAKATDSKSVGLVEGEWNLIAKLHTYFPCTHLGPMLKRQGFTRAIMVYVASDGRIDNVAAINLDEATIKEQT